MNDNEQLIIKLKIELEETRRTYWQSQQQLTQLLIERSLAIEKVLQVELQGELDKGGILPSVSVLAT